MVFEEVVCGCMKAGLVGGEGFVVDASVIEADASCFQRVEGARVEWSEEALARRPVAEYVTALESVNPTTNPERPPKAMSPVDPSAESANMSAIIDQQSAKCDPDLIPVRRRYLSQRSG